MVDAGGTDAFFAANLRAARERAGLSQEGLAEKMATLGRPMRQQVIARIETGQRQARVGEADALARAVGTTLDALTRAQGAAEHAALIADETEQAREAHAAAIAQAHEFAVLTERLPRRIAAAEAAGYAGELKAEIDAAREVVALPPPLGYQESLIWPT